MKKVVAGALITIIILAICLVIWLSLDDQARGVVVGVLLGIVGLIAGIIVALAAVGILLLIQLRWSVNSSTASPMLHGQNTPQLPTASMWQQAPPTRRPQREWDVVGAEDVTEGDFTSL